MSVPTQYRSLNTDLPTNTQFYPSQSSQLGSSIPIPHGNTILKTFLLMVGSMEGAGILGLPFALASAGWGGIVYFFLGIFCAHQGCILGECLQKLGSLGVNKTWPNLGRIVWGARGDHAIRLLIDITLFGVAVTLLLLGGHNLNILFPSLDYRYGVLIIAAIVTPITWANSPKDFWWSGAIAVVATNAAIIILLFQMYFNGSSKKLPDNDIAKQGGVNFFSAASAFGIVTFSYGGIPGFPVMQKDMIQPKDFPKPVWITFLCLMAIYIPVSCMVFGFYGEKTPDNLLLILPHDALSVCVVVAITLHIAFSYVIILNPLSQHIEQHFYPKLGLPVYHPSSLILDGQESEQDILLSESDNDSPHPHQFKPSEDLTPAPHVNSQEIFWRILFRTATTIFAMIFAVLIKKFGLALSIVGSSTVSLFTFTFPSMFYLELLNPTDKYEILKHKAFIIFGIVATILGTGSAIYQIIIGY